jgi:hypothetical protein
MKEMRPIQVSCDGVHVWLVQPDPSGNDDAAVVLSPEQVPLVIRWMREAAATATHEGA